jgi:hypothetical protein
MDLVDRIDEATKKPSFVQYFFAKKNYKKLQNEFENYWSQNAQEMGQDFLEDDRYYTEEELEFEEIDPMDAYDNFAHTAGYQVEWDSATEVVLSHKRKYDYKRGDEKDNNELLGDFIDYMGYSTSWGSRSKKTQDYWKMAEEE